MDVHTLPVRSLLAALIVAAGPAFLSGCRFINTHSAKPPAQDSRTITFQPEADIDYRFTDVIFLPDDLISNPSGLAFGGRLEDGRLLLWTVCDGSAITRDRIDPSRVVVKLILSPDGRTLRDVVPLTLDQAIRPCDLEAIAVDPADGNLVIGDERVAREPDCGGTGPEGQARSILFKITPEGERAGGPWDTPIVNNGNNGIEAIAARSETDGTHIFVFEERKRGKVPVVLEYLLSPASPEKLAILRTFRIGLPVNATQTGATFRNTDGRLLLLDRNKGELLEVDLDGCPGGDTVLCMRSASFEALIEQELGLEGVQTDTNRFGLAEGIAEDDRGNLYMVLDNNSRPYFYGDRTPRMIRFEPVVRQAD